MAPGALRVPKIVALLLLILFLAARAIAGEAEPGAEPKAAPSWTAAQRDAALKRAFGYLDDHMWRLSDRSPWKRHAIAVAGWAYLLAAERSGMRLPCRAKQVRRIRSHLERTFETLERGYDRFDKDGRWPAGRPTSVPGVSITRERSFTWTLSAATLFFAESVARGEDERYSRSVLRRLVAVLERSQQANGGWGHDDARVPGLGITGSGLPDLSDYPKTLTGATSCAASALGTAYRLLGTPDPRSVPLAIRYYREAQHPDGTFAYSLCRKRRAAPPPEPGDRDLSVIARARTAGALYALYCLGAEPDQDPVPKAAAVVERSLEELSEGHGSATLALQFGALLSRTQGAERWAAFRGMYFPRILAVQAQDGSFRCICRHEADAVTCDSEPDSSGIGSMPGYRERMQLEQNVYVTAIHCLILVLDRSPSRLAPPVPATTQPVTPR